MLGARRRLYTRGLMVPTGRLAIDWSNPLSKDLCFCSVLNTGQVAVDLVRGYTAIIGNTSVDTCSQYGPGVLFDATLAGAAMFVDQTTGAALPIVPNTDITLLSVANPAASGSQAPVLFSQGNDASNLGYSANLIANVNAGGGFNSGQIALYLETVNLTSLQGCNSINTNWVDGNFHCFVGRYTYGTGSNSTSTIWRDGVNITGVTDNTGVQSDFVNTGANTNGMVAIGNFHSDGDLFGADCTVHAAMAWNRALSNDEIAFISANPYSFLVPVVDLFDPMRLAAAPATGHAIYARYGAAHGVGALSAIPGEIPS